MRVISFPHVASHQISPLATVESRDNSMFSLCLCGGHPVLLLSTQPFGGLVALLWSTGVWGLSTHSALTWVSAKSKCSSYAVRATVAKVAPYFNDSFFTQGPPLTRQSQTVFTSQGRERHVMESRSITKWPQSMMADTNRVRNRIG